MTRHCFANLVIESCQSRIGFWTGSVSLLSVYPRVPGVLLDQRETGGDLRNSLEGHLIFGLRLKSLRDPSDQVHEVALPGVFCHQSGVTRVIPFPELVFGRVVRLTVHQRYSELRTSDRFDDPLAYPGFGL